FEQVPNFSITIFDKEQRPVALLEPNKSDSGLKVNQEYMEFTVKHYKVQLSKGVYNVNISINKENGMNPLLRINGILSFQIVHPEETWPPFLLETEFINA